MICSEPRDKLEMDGAMDRNDQVRSCSSTDDINDLTDISVDISDQILLATAVAPHYKSDMMSADKPTFIKPADNIDMDLLEEGIPRIVDGLETPDSEAHTTFQEFFIESENILWNLETQDTVEFEEEVCVNKSKANCLEVNLNSSTTIDEPTNDKDIPVSRVETENNDAVATSKAAVKISSMKHKRKKSAIIPPHIPEIKEQFDNTCTICDKTFARKDKVMRHMLIHIPEIPEYCQLCDRLMVREDVYLLQTITTDLRFACKKCEEFFCGRYPPLGGKMEVVHWFQKSDIFNYMKNEKKVRDPCLEFVSHRFSCDICEENFILEQSLAFHVRKMHTDNQDSDNASKSATVAQKSPEQNAKKSRKLSPLIESLKAGPRNGKSTRIFTCDFCHHPYRHKISWTNHMKTCTGEREFPCDLCDIICTRKNELNVHKKKDHRTLQASQIDY